MISVTHIRGLADPRLKATPRLALSWLHSVLSWTEYRPVKLLSLRHGILCSQAEAYKALVALERFGYLEAKPNQSKPKHYRLVNPAILVQETSRSA